MARCRAPGSHLEVTLVRQPFFGSNLSPHFVSAAAPAAGLHFRPLADAAADGRNHFTPGRFAAQHLPTGHVRSISRRPVPPSGGEPCRLSSPAGVCVSTITLLISYDPAKREKTLQERGLDFEDAPIVFDGLTAEVEDARREYGERRIVCFGVLAGRMVVVGYTPRGAVRHIFSMRKANDREKARFGPSLGL